jgi:hypothetical protein
LLTRPFEFILLGLAVLLFIAPPWRQTARIAAVASLAFLPAAALTLLQNKAVTGSWTTLPYVLSRYQYGIPTTFTFEPNPTPHRPLNQEQQVDYEVQSEVHGKNPETIGRYARRLLDRVRFYRFFFLAPLYAALPFFLLGLRESRFRRILLCLLVFTLGTNFYPYFYPHYIAAAACLLILVAVTGLERMSRWIVRGLPAGQELARAIVFLCAVHFLFWYGLHLGADERLAAAMWPYQSWDNINHGDPEGRDAIDRRLAEAPGRQLVFIRYSPKHLMQEWVHNEANIDSSRVVWASDLGPTENPTLLRYYPDRTAWLLEPDRSPPKLTPYPGVAGDDNGLHSVK